VPLNLDVQKNLYTTDSMGTVGNAFQQLVGFQQTFAVNPDDLSDSQAAQSLPTIFEFLMAFESIQFKYTLRPPSRRRFQPHRLLCL